MDGEGCIIPIFFPDRYLPVSAARIQHGKDIGIEERVDKLSIIGSEYESSTDAVFSLR